MKKATKLELEKEFDKLPSRSIDGNQLSKAFLELVKDLEIEKGKNLSITDSIYLQPFKIEYLENSSGFKGYFHGMDKQLEEKKEQYVKLCVKRDEKLVVIKSFGKVAMLDSQILNKLLLMIRLSQYVYKTRELYSLEIAVKQLLK